MHLSLASTGSCFSAGSRNFFCSKDNEVQSTEKSTAFGRSGTRWLKNEKIAQVIPNSETVMMFPCRVEVKERSMALDIVYVLVTTWQLTQCTSYDQARTKVSFTNHVHTRCFMMKFAKVTVCMFPENPVWKQIGSDSLLVRLIPSEKVVLFVWTKCSKKKFLFHFFKAISVYTSLRPSCSRPFSQLMAPQAGQDRCITEHITVFFDTILHITNDLQTFYEYGCKNV